MKKVFLDTDVLMDFLTKRVPFEVEAMKLMEYSYRKKIEVNISSLCINNIHYVVSKIENKEKSREKVKGLLKLVEILSVDRKIIEKAAYSEFKDFEDGIQNYCAEANGIKILVTRNVKDYSKSNLAIQTPREFIQGFEKGK